MNTIENVSGQDDIRPGCVDMWNAFMVKGAEFTLGSDMPICCGNDCEEPRKLISYVDAKHIHKMNKKENPNYHIDAYVHFYIDDQKFDGPKSSIWLYPQVALEVLSHFSGVITPDFSTCADFPDPIKRFNTYRMRSFGRWLTTFSIPVINNVRWGTEETWEYCFDGIPYNGTVAIGTVASGIDKHVNRPVFEAGLLEMIRVLKPHTIVVYGSSNNKVFKTAFDLGIKIIPFKSDTNTAFSAKNGGKKNE